MFALYKEPDGVVPKATTLNANAVKIAIKFSTLVAYGLNMVSPVPFLNVSVIPLKKSNDLIAG